MKVKLTIDPTVKPVRQALGKIPITTEETVERKLNKALRNGFIKRVQEPSQWVSPIVVIFKPNGDIRICVDMRRANEAIRRENYPLPTFDGFMMKLRDARYFSKLDSQSQHLLPIKECSDIKDYCSAFIQPQKSFNEFSKGSYQNVSSA